mgnify:CR=1 FL=1
MKRKMYSTLVRGTHPNKLKMNWWEYWIGHCWMTGWQSIKYSFQNWADLMTGNWDNYALMFYDDPYEECNDCFWSYLGDDDTLPKAFLEDLMKIVDDIETGKEKVVPLDEDFFDRMKELTDGVELDDDL